MSMSVVYTTVNGVLLEENRGGVITTYVPDTLGSVIQTKDASGNVTSEATYWPYGEAATSSGTNPSPWGFCGALGYYTDAENQLYVRARTLRPDLSRWVTVDLFWPDEPAYEYGANNPAAVADPSGMLTVIVDPSCGMPPYGNHAIAFKVRQLCDRLDSQPSCGCRCGDWQNTFDCLKKKCSSTIRVRCLDAAQCRTFCKQGRPGALPCACATTPGGTVSLCPPSLDFKACDCLQNTILHEMSHGCGQGDESVPNCIADSCSAGLPECAKTVPPKWR